MPIHASRQPLDVEHEAGVARLENHELWGITLPLIASCSIALLKKHGLHVGAKDLKGKLHK